MLVRPPDHCIRIFHFRKVSVTVNPDGTTNVSAGGAIYRWIYDWSDADQSKLGNDRTIAGEYGATIGLDGKITQNDPPEEEPGTEPTDPTEPTEPTDTPTIPGFDIPMAGDFDGAAVDATVTITDGETPLAGLVSREMLLAQLYIHEGSPDGEDAEGEYVKALAWGIENDIVDETDDPEEIVTVAILRDVMSRYAAFLGVTVDVEIPGEDDDIVMNCDEILNKFFDTLEA